MSKNDTIQQAISAATQLKANADKQVNDYTQISNYYADLINGLEASVGLTPSTETPPTNSGGSSVSMQDGDRW